MLDEWKLAFLYFQILNEIGYRKSKWEMLLL